MSFLVKRMEMPLKCGLCPCFHADNPMYCQAVQAEMGKRIVAPYEQPRPDWCPLVGVPQPHGRLIDADALIENHFSDGHRIAMSYADKWWMRKIINDSPTIAPAEET